MKGLIEKLNQIFYHNQPKEFVLGFNIAKEMCVNGFKRSTY